MSRQFRLPSTTQTSREGLEETTCVSISGANKLLRKASRTLHATEGPLRDELHILERIYYKNLNAQRVTIPWRRLAEVRRICGRLLESDLADFVDSVRAAFYDGDLSKPTVKSMKLLWTHVPSSRFLETAIRRTAALQQLILKIMEVCYAAYSIHAKYLNNLGFLTYTVTVLSIVARLRRIAGEQEEGCIFAFNGMLQALEALKPGSSKKYVLLSKHSELAATDVAAGQGIPLAAFQQAEAEGLDLGQAIARASYLPALPNQTTSLAPSVVEPILIDDEEDEGVSLDPLIVTAAVGDTQMETTVIKTIEKNAVAIVVVEDKRIKKIKESKKPSKRDEIDDIFGF